MVPPGLRVLRRVNAPRLDKKSAGWTRSQAWIWIDDQELLDDDLIEYHAESVSRIFMTQQALARLRFRPRCAQVRLRGGRATDAEAIA